MKLKMTTAAIIISLALASTSLANNWRGGNNYRNPQMQGAMMNQQVDQATLDKINKFRIDNQAAQKEIMMKNAAKMALLNGTNPDPAAITQITGELFDLRNSLREKAIAAGITGYMGHYTMGTNSMGQIGNRHGGRGFNGSGVRW